MAIPFKSNITVPNSWEIKDERNSSIYKVTYASGSQSRTTDIYGGNTLNLKIGYVNVATFNTNNVNLGTTGLPTNIKGNQIIINDATYPTTIDGSTINIGSSTTSSVNIGNTNNKVVINPMNLTISTANGWTINNTTGTAGQVLTSNGAALSPTWQNLIKIEKIWYTDSPIVSTTNSYHEERIMWDTLNSKGLQHTQLSPYNILIMLAQVSDDSWVVPLFNPEPNTTGDFNIFSEYGSIFPYSEFGPSFYAPYQPRKIYISDNYFSFNLNQMLLETKSTTVGSPPNNVGLGVDFSSVAQHISLYGFLGIKF